jgi:hypothetical protein
MSKERMNENNDKTCTGCGANLTQDQNHSRGCKYGPKDLGIIDVGDACIECGCSTAAGSGSWANRIPADDGIRLGYKCVDCQMIECDRCEDKRLHYEIIDGYVVCGDCITEEERLSIEAD